MSPTRPRAISELAFRQIKRVSFNSAPLVPIGPEPVCRRRSRLDRDPPRLRPDELQQFADYRQALIDFFLRCRFLDPFRHCRGMRQSQLQHQDAQADTFLDARRVCGKGGRARLPRCSKVDHLRARFRAIVRHARKSANYIGHPFSCPAFLLCRGLCALSCNHFVRPRAASSLETRQ